MFSKIEKKWRDLFCTNVESKQRKLIYFEARISGIYGSLKILNPEESFAYIITTFNVNCLCPLKNKLYTIQHEYGLTPPPLSQISLYFELWTVDFFGFSGLPFGDLQNFQTSYQQKHKTCFEFRMIKQS